MKILPITNHFIYQNTLFPVEQKLTNFIYAAVPDIVTSRKIVFIQYDNAPWFHSNNIIQIWEENIKLEMIALVSNSSEEVRKLIDEYNSYLEEWKKKANNKSTIDQLNKLYEL